jgi:hypothetical protein
MANQQEKSSGCACTAEQETIEAAAPETLQPNRLIPGRYTAERLSLLNIVIADRLEGESGDLIASIRKAQRNFPSAVAIASVARCESDRYNHCYQVRMRVGEYHIAMLYERFQRLLPRYIVLDMRPVPTDSGP